VLNIVGKDISNLSPKGVICFESPKVSSNVGPYKLPQQSSKFGNQAFSTGGDCLTTLQYLSLNEHDIPEQGTIDH